MAKRRHAPQQVINKLIEAEVARVEGSIATESARRFGVTEQTFYRWRSEYGELRIDQLQAPEAPGAGEQPPEESGGGPGAGQPDTEGGV